MSIPDIPNPIFWDETIALSPLTTMVMDHIVQKLEVVVGISNVEGVEHVLDNRDEAFIVANRSDEAL